MTSKIQGAVGQPIERVDGRLKVTGRAPYTAEVSLAGLANAVLVDSPIASGRIKSIDLSAAEKSPGFLGALTPQNVGRLNSLPEDITGPGKPGEQRTPLQDDIVHFAGQHVAVVIAETFEQATAAAALIRVEYEKKEPALDLLAARQQTPETFFGREDLQVHRGNIEKGLRAGEVKFEQTYETPVEVHNPIEMGAVIAAWNGHELFLHDTTRWLVGVQTMVATVLGQDKGHLRVLCPYVGGAFGSKGFFWNHQVLAALAARLVGRPVRLVLTRGQMFTALGRRPRTVQTMTLAATRDGKLTGLRHAVQTETSPISNFIEPAGLMTCNLYACPNLEVTHREGILNLATPTFMRAPGETPGMFALESAMDELAYALGLDPIELRLTNHADEDPYRRRPYSNKNLKECYQRGADRFGWKQRTPRPSSMRDGEHRIGWGMATASYPQREQEASARATIYADGHAVVASATHEIGQGVRTIMSQLAATALGLPVERVRFELGDSWLPTAPITGGSWTTVSVGPAVMASAELLKTRLILLAVADAQSPLHGATASDVVAADGKLLLPHDANRTDTYAAILRRAGKDSLDAVGERPKNEDADRFTFQSFGAQFAEVKVDSLGQVRVTRFVGVFDTGRILNPRTARSQFIGGITMGIGSALMEESVYDPRTGKPVTDNFAEYRVPVNLDIPEIDVAFLDRPDPYISPLGAHGAGEIGITGVNAAIANAVFHATGKRIRALPITPDKLL